MYRQFVNVESPYSLRFLAHTMGGKREQSARISLNVHFKSDRCIGSHDIVHVKCHQVDMIIYMWTLALYPDLEAGYEDNVNVCSPALPLTLKK